MNTSNPASNEPKLTLHMEGLEQDGGDMKFGVFIEKLRSLRSALHEADRIIHGADGERVSLVVSDLTHNSPAAVTLRCPGSSGALNGGDVFQFFSETVQELSHSGGRARNASIALLEKILELCNGYGDRFTRMWLSDGRGHRVGFTSTTRENVLVALGRTTHAYGSVKGRVERYNGHGDRKYFNIYPLLGERVKCLFEDSLRQEAAAAVERTVIVHGQLYYYDGQFFPFQVVVDAIEVTDESPPALAKLIGSAPNATGDQSSVEFIKDKRNEWH